MHAYTPMDRQSAVIEYPDRMLSNISKNETGIINKEGLLN